MLISNENKKFTILFTKVFTKILLPFGLFLEDEFFVFVRLIHPFNDDPVLAVHSVCPGGYVQLVTHECPLCWVRFHHVLRVFEGFWWRILVGAVHHFLHKVCTKLLLPGTLLQSLGEHQRTGQRLVDIFTTENN